MNARRNASQRCERGSRLPSYQFAAAVVAVVLAGGGLGYTLTNSSQATGRTQPSASVREHREHQKSPPTAVPIASRNSTTGAGTIDAGTTSARR
jgi:hypothetical protein